MILGKRMIKKNSKIYITGHKGLWFLVLNLLKKNGYKNVVKLKEKIESFR